jgi:sorbitol-specific phosphotransferase system component IIA
MSKFAAAQSRATSRLLTHVGETATLRGTVPCVAAIQHGVVVDGLYGEVSVYRTVAFLLESLVPRAGDTLTVGTKDYVIDAVDSGNGYLTRVIIR